MCQENQKSVQKIIGADQSADELNIYPIFFQNIAGNGGWCVFALDSDASQNPPRKRMGAGRLAR
jgi:hypothetical protein